MQQKSEMIFKTEYAHSFKIFFNFFQKCSFFYFSFLYNKIKRKNKKNIKLQKGLSILKQSEDITEIGVNGKELGSNVYFKDLNEKSKISEIMIRADSMVYYESLKAKNANLIKAIREIKQDLEQNISAIRYISAGDRKELKKFLSGLNGSLP